MQYLLKDLELTQLKKEIQSKVHTDLDQQQRDQYLRHQIRVLQEELGDSEVEELETLRAKGRKKQWPEEVAAFFNKSIDKAERLSLRSPYLHHSFFSIVQALLVAEGIDIDVNVANNDGQTPLHVAAARGHAAIVVIVSRSMSRRVRDHFWTHFRERESPARIEHWIVSMLKSKGEKRQNFSVCSMNRVV